MFDSFQPFAALPNCVSLYIYMMAKILNAINKLGRTGANVGNIEQPLEVCL